MKKALLAISIFITLIITICLIRVFTFSSKQIEAEKSVSISIDAMTVAQHLSNAIKIKTISNHDSKKIDHNTFKSLHRYLERTYPLLHKHLKKETFNGLSLLYVWKGSDNSKKPILMVAHQDVVPVEKRTLKDWKYPPFSGAIKEGFVWGRGTLDMKNCIITIMDSIEYLLKKGFRPKQTIYLAFGHDEEVGGENGAKVIAGKLKEKNVRLSMVLDEGGTIIKGVMPGLDKDIALVGVAEKGYVTLKLIAHDKGGHSSMPPKITAVGKIARAIERLQSNPFPATMPEPLRMMFEYAGPEMPFSYRLLFSNMWLFNPLIKSQLSNVPSTDAAMRTTTAPTMLSGSQQENVLPQVATGIINFRIQLDETIDSVVARVKDVIDDDSITIEIQKSKNNPVPYSDVNSNEFTLLHQTIAEVFPGVIVAPYIVLGGTDSKHYKDIADLIFRFLPNKLVKSDLDRMHGTNERISIENLRKGVIFYIRLLQRFN